MSVDTSTLHQLRALQQAYTNDLPQRIGMLEQLWSRRHDTVTLATLHIQTHSLAGSGATFGFGEVSQVARRLEILLKAVLAGEQVLDETRVNHTEQLFKELRDAATRPVSWGQGLEEVSQSSVRRGLKAARDIVLLKPDPVRGNELCTQLQTLGYPCKVVASEIALLDWLQTATPLAAVLDADHYHASGPLLDSAGRKVPLVFLSAHDELSERLRCVRVGGSAYFTEPVDALALTDVLDELTLRNPREPYRILIVEDTKDLASYYGFILDNAAMNTLIVTDPMAVMEALHQFNPDLVLMDLYMPACNGLELAAVIRQQQTFVGIPIVFLSGETDIDKQLIAMSHGADDFLNKSITSGYLVRSVAARVARSRNMRSLMMRDSLTGLYNHTSIKEQLDRELARAARLRVPLAYAMLDIDKFKSVNDNHGHPTGDRVIKALSRYLKQRLRGSDLIGRYGGEEFAVILPDTTVESALRVLDAIRSGFGQLPHSTEQGDISITFSGGIAGYPGHATAKALNDAADKALYHAKQTGRNRIAVAD